MQATEKVDKVDPREDRKKNPGSPSVLSVESLSSSHRVTSSSQNFLLDSEPATMFPVTSANTPYATNQIDTAIAISSTSLSSSQPSSTNILTSNSKFNNAPTVSFTGSTKSCPNNKTLTSDGKELNPNTFFSLIPHADQSQDILTKSPTVTALSSAVENTTLRNKQVIKPLSKPRLIKTHVQKVKLSTPETIYQFISPHVTGPGVTTKAVNSAIAVSRTSVTTSHASGISPQPKDQAVIKDDIQAGNKSNVLPTVSLGKQKTSPVKQVKLSQMTLNQQEGTKYLNISTPQSRPYTVSLLSGECYETKAVTTEPSLSKNDQNREIITDCAHPQTGCVVTLPRSRTSVSSSSDSQPSSSPRGGLPAPAATESPSDISSSSSSLFPERLRGSTSLQNQLSGQPSFFQQANEREKEEETVTQHATAKNQMLLSTSRCLSSAMHPTIAPNPRTETKSATASDSVRLHPLFEHDYVRLHPLLEHDYAQSNHLTENIQSKMTVKCKPKQKLKSKHTKKPSKTTAASSLATFRSAILNKYSISLSAKKRLALDRSGKQNRNRLKDCLNNSARTSSLDTAMSSLQLSSSVESMALDSPHAEYSLCSLPTQTPVKPERPNQRPIKREHLARRTSSWLNDHVCYTTKKTSGRNYHDSFVKDGANSDWNEDSSVKKLPYNHVKPNKRHAATDVELYRDLSNTIDNISQFTATDTASGTA